MPTRLWSGWVAVVAAAGWVAGAASERTRTPRKSAGERTRTPRIGWARRWPMAAAVTVAVANTFDVANRRPIAELAALLRLNRAASVSVRSVAGSVRGWWCDARCVSLRGASAVRLWIAVVRRRNCSAAPHACVLVWQRLLYTLGQRVERDVRAGSEQGSRGTRAEHRRVGHAAVGVLVRRVPVGHLLVRAPHSVHRWRLGDESRRTIAGTGASATPAASGAGTSAGAGASATPAAIRAMRRGARQST